MVVALSAGNIGSQECGERVGQAVERHTGISQEVCGSTILSKTTFCSEHVIDNFIPWAILPKLGLEPCVEGVGLSNSIVVIFHTKHVSQPVEHVRLVPRGFEQLIN